MIIYKPVNKENMYNYNSAYFKQAARMQLTGQWGSAALFTFVFNVISYAVNGLSSLFLDAMMYAVAFVIGVIAGLSGMDVEAISAADSSIFTLLVMLPMYPLIFLFSYVIYFLLSPLMYSFNVSFLDNKRSGVSLDPGRMFKGYKELMRIGGTTVLMYLYAALWSLLLLIPGIVKYISYSQTYYVMHDNPGLSYNKAIERSMAMMDGYKMRYFKLLLSFIGWFLLNLITCGISTFWVTPYMQTAFAHFYEFVKEEYEKKTSAAEPAVNE